MKKGITHNAFKAVLILSLLSLNAFSQQVKQPGDYTLTGNGHSYTLHTCKGQSVAFVVAAIPPNTPASCNSAYEVDYFWRIDRNLKAPDPTKRSFSTYFTSGSTYVTDTLQDGDEVICTGVLYTYSCPTGLQYVNGNGYGSPTEGTSVFMYVAQPSNPTIDLFGPVVVYANTSVIYNVTNPVANVYYNWNVTGIGTIASGNGTSSITVNTGNQAITGGTVDVNSYPLACPSLFNQSAHKGNISLLNLYPTNASNFRVTGTVDHNTVSLAWTAATDNAGLGIESYMIYYLDTKTNVQNSVTITDGTATSYNLGGLIEGHPYRFYIVAFNTGGANSTESATSSQPINTTPYYDYYIDLTPPSQPVLSYNPMSVTAQEVSLNWNVPADTVGTTSYDLYMNGTLNKGGITMNSYYVTGITNLTANTFYIIAKDAKGNPSQPSNTLSIVPTAPFIISNTTGYIGLGIDPPTERLDIDGNEKIRGNINVLGNYYQNGVKVDMGLWANGGFHDPNDTNQTRFQGQVSNVWKQKLLLNADVTEIAGAVSAWSGISVGGRNKYILGGPDLINNLPAYGVGMTTGNGMVQVAGYYGINFVDNTFGTAPSMIIKDGQVTTSGVLFAKGGLKLPDGSLLNGTQGYLINGQSNVSFSDKLQVTGTDPYFRIGSLVMQDITTSTSSSYIEYNNSGNIIHNEVLITPQAFVFGNMYYDPATLKYKSVYSLSDSISTSQNSAGGVITTTQRVGQNGGIALNFNSGSGDMEFLAIPSTAGTNLNSHWSIDQSQIENYKRMVIKSGGNVGIGENNPTSKLVINGLGGTNIDLLVNGRIQSNNNNGGLAISTDRIVGGHSTNKIGLYNGGAWQLTVQHNGYVGIGTLTPTAKLEVAGNVKIDGTLTINNRVDATEFHACVSPGTCPDFVFSDTYPLMDLKTLRTYLDKNKHLPNVPSAKVMEQEGMNINEMNLLMLRKMEELTLYVLQLESEIQKLKATK